jgi:hypothetical protein
MANQNIGLAICLISTQIEFPHASIYASIHHAHPLYLLYVMYYYYLLSIVKGGILSVCLDGTVKRFSTRYRQVESRRTAVRGRVYRTNCNLKKKNLTYTHFFSSCTNPVSQRSLSLLPCTRIANGTNDEWISHELQSGSSRFYSFFFHWLNPHQLPDLTFVLPSWISFRYSQRMVSPIVRRRYIALLFHL